MPIPVALIALVEALATASATSLAVPAYKQSRFLGPLRINMERAGNTGGGTVWGASLPGQSSDPSKYHLAQGDGTASAIQTAIPHVALSNNNYLVRISRSPRTGTVTITAGSQTITGSSSAFLTELRIGDEVRVGEEVRVVIAIASATVLTVDRPFVNAYTAQALSLVDGFLAPTTDFTVSNVGGFAAITPAAAAKNPVGAKVEIMFVTPVAIFTYATATLQFKELEVPQGFDALWYASDATASPSSTTIYAAPLGQ